jgi:hypothetical protein
MKFALPAIALACSGLAAAQFDNQTAPFNLVLVSKNKTIDGQYLYSCHEGAAIEGLCLAGKKPTVSNQFNFNYSSQSVTPNPTLGTPGYVTWVLHGGNFNESEALGLYNDPTSNVALPLFEPGYSATVMAFDDKNLLNIQGYVDDTVSPPKAGDWVAYYRWYACTTYYSGYTYQTLAWALGAGKPQNPTCVKVDVKRVFV